jgi:hypothetical protein
VAPVGLRRKIAERHAKAIENEKPRVRAKPLRRPQSERGRHAGRSSPRR